MRDADRTGPTGVVVCRRKAVPVPSRADRGRVAVRPGAVLADCAGMAAGATLATAPGGPRADPGTTGRAPFPGESPETSLPAHPADSRVAGIGTEAYTWASPAPLERPVAPSPHPGDGLDDGRRPGRGVLRMMEYAYFAPTAAWPVASTVASVAGILLMSGRLLGRAASWLAVLSTDVPGGPSIRRAWPWLAAGGLLASPAAFPDRAGSSPSAGAAGSSRRSTGPAPTAITRT